MNQLWSSVLDSKTLIEMEGFEFEGARRGSKSTEGKSVLGEKNVYTDGNIAMVRFFANARSVKAKLSKLMIGNSILLEGENQAIQK